MIREKFSPFCICITLISGVVFAVFLVGYGPILKYDLFMNDIGATCVCNFREL